MTPNFTADGNDPETAEQLQRTLHHLGERVKELTALHMTMPTGRMMMQMVGVFAEFELEMIRERTQAGLKVVEEEGRTGGRQPTLREDQRTNIIENILDGRKTGAQMARLYSVSEATISWVMAAHRQALARD